MASTDTRTMNDKVVDSNPYSRLMALKRMGIVKDYESIRDFTLAIVGVGGVGSVASDMLTRCGVGKLILFDYDKVELANMNRLFYQPSQSGMSKVEAAKQTLQHINPDVEIEIYNFNITTLSNYEKFVDIIRTRGQNRFHGNEGGSRPVHVILSCVDNFEARMAINMACNENDMEWMESGVSENAVSGHIQYLVPGITACFACAPPLIVAENIDEKTIKKEGVCAASLPTTMAIIAGLLVQNCLKLILKFGQVSAYLGYNALLDYFPKTVLKPNPTCTDPWCLKRQASKSDEQRLEFYRTFEQFGLSKLTDATEPVSHEDDWGISVIEDSGTKEDRPSDLSSSSMKTHQGLKHQYEMAHGVGGRVENFGDHQTIDTSPESLEDLMKKMKSL